MHMKDLHALTVTHIEQPLTVHSARGRTAQITDRPTFGLSLSLGGQITYTIHGKTYVSDPDHAVLLPQGGTYSLFGDREGLFPVINFTCDHLDCHEIRVLPLRDPQACIRDFERLRDLFFFGGDRLAIYSTFYGLLHKIAAAQEPARHPLRPLLRYVEAHIADPDLSNTALAKQLGIGEVYLRKLFAAHCGTTPKQYVLELRIRKAQQLLAETPLTVTAVAEACGFTSLYHFCRAFKGRTGVTPTRYAEQHRLYRI